jgi:hypothetical protein
MNRTQLLDFVGIGDLVRVTDTPTDSLTGTPLNTNAGVVESTRYIELLGDDGRLRDRGLSVMLRELETPVGVPQVRVELWSLDLQRHWQVEARAAYTSALNIQRLLENWRAELLVQGASLRPIVIHD